MELDDIVVLCLAILFFGGIGYLAVKERKKEMPQDVQPAAPPQTNNGGTEQRKKRKKRSRQ